METKSTDDEVLDFYVKATGTDGTKKRQQLVNMRPGDLRRSLERWQAREKEVQHLQKEQAWELCRRVPNYRHKKEDFDKDSKHKVVYNGKADERSLQEWTDEMQSQVHAAERQLEARERKWMELEDSSFQRCRVWEKLWAPRAFASSPYLASSCSFFGGDSTKAISVISGAMTKSQRALGSTNSLESVTKDTVRNGAK